MSLQSAEHPVAPSTVLEYEPRSWTRSWWQTLLLQSGHRLGSVGLIVLIATVGLLVTGRNYTYALPAAFIAGDLGLVASFLSLWLARRAGSDSRESRGVLILNAVVVIPAVALMILTHRGILP